MDIHKFKLKSLLWGVVRYGFTGGLKALPLILVGVLLLGFLEHQSNLSSLQLKILWAGLLISGFGLVIYSFWPLQLFSTSSHSYWLAFHSKATVPTTPLREDDYFLLEQFESLANKNPGAGWSKLVVQQLQNKLAHVRVRDSYPPWKESSYVWLTSLAILISSLLIFSLPHYFKPSRGILFPFRSSLWIEQLKIFPGDAKVPWAQDTQIIVTTPEISLYPPRLYIKLGLSWQEIQPRESNQGTYRFDIKKITTPIYYRVEWKKEWSARYTLTPQPPTTYGPFQVELFPPAYLRATSLRQDKPEILGLPGTRVVYQVEVNPHPSELKLLFSDGTELKPKRLQQNGYEFEFFLDTDKTYQLNDSSPFPIYVRSDLSPQIELLSPQEDLIVGEREDVPLTYEVQDDYGLQSVDLFMEVNGQKKAPIPLRSWNPPVGRALETYRWELAKFSFRSGDIIRYRLRVQDANTVQGPGVGTSVWRVLEIQSFEQDHAALEQGLELWRDKTTQLLAQLTQQKIETGKENSDMDKLGGDFNELVKNSLQTEKLLEKIVSKMEKDPLADYGVWLEHQSIKENMSRLNHETVPSIQASYQTKNKPEALAEMTSMISELERMIALSEDLTKAQKASDVMNSGEKMEQLAKDMMEEIGSGKIDADTKSKINSLVDQAMENLRQLAQSLHEMPQTLPEDFVNQSALKDLNLNTPRDILSQISEAIKNGDGGKALALAQELLKAAQSLNKKISSAHDSFLKSHSPSEIEKSIDEQRKELDDVIEKQSDILSQTQTLDTKRRQQLLQKQADHLIMLARKQSEVIEKNNKLLSTNFKESSFAGVVANQVPLMQSILHELETKQIDKTREWLISIVNQFDLVRSQLGVSTATGHYLDQIIYIRDQEQMILTQLTSPLEMKASFTDEEMKKFEALKNEQLSLGNKTEQVQKKVQALSRKTASLSSTLLQNLSRANRNMKEAADFLNRAESLPAQNLEEKALQELIEGSQKMGEAQSQMMEMRLGEGQGSQTGGNVRAISRGRDGGSSGSKNEKVRLPTADEYHPPKEFRDDILKALKEKYPKAYETLIQKYYKRLVE